MYEEHEEVTAHLLPEPQNERDLMQFLSRLIMAMVHVMLDTFAEN